MWDPCAEFEKKVLSNGLTIYASEWKGKPWERVGFLVSGGAKDDPIDKPGLAHFVEHLVPNNVQGFSWTDIRNLFDSLGGSAYLGGTSFLATRYKFFAPIEKDVLKRSLEVFGQMLLLGDLKNHIERERSAILSEFRQKFIHDNFYQLSCRESKMVFGGTILENFTSAIGSPKSINSIKQDDVMSFYKKYYAPANITMVCVGGLSISEVEEMVLGSPFALHLLGETPLRILPEPKISFPEENEYQFETFGNGSNHVSEGLVQYLATAKLPEGLQPGIWLVLRNMVNKLIFAQVREKLGIAYNVSLTSQARFGNFRKVMFQSGRINRRELPVVVDIINNAIEALGREEELFNQVRRGALNANNMLDMSSAALLDEVVDDLTYRGRIITYKETNESLSNLVLQDILEVGKYLSKEYRWELINKI